MTFSIRKFLLINLLTAIIVITTLTVMGNFYLDAKDINRHLDSLLQRTNYLFEVLLQNNMEEEHLKKIQASFATTAPLPDYHLFSDKYGSNAADGAGKYQFQIWNKDKKLLLHSPNAPHEILNTPEGFSHTIINGDNWRVYSRYSPELEVTIAVAERQSLRTELANRIVHDDIYIMLLIYPLSVALIWIIVGRGLSSLKRISAEITKRIPNYLEPIDTHATPLEIKPLIEELNKLFLRLQDAFEREKRFAGDAAHELRTPLAALKTQAQVALNATDETERRQLLKNVIMGVDRCTHVVQQLLTLSRLVPDANTPLTDITSVNLSKLAAEVVAQLAPFALSKQIDIELVAEDDRINIQGNATALAILVRNLVDNAIRYTPQNGIVQVYVHTEDRNAILKVTDNGQGIPAELRARVFERFFRVLGNKSPGSGLGLAIVQQIAHLHGAEVKLGAPPVGTGLEVEVVFAIAS